MYSPRSSDALIISGGVVASVEGAVVVGGVVVVVAPVVTVVVTDGLVVVSVGDVVTVGDVVPGSTVVSARVPTHARDTTIIKESIADKKRMQPLVFFITVTSVLFYKKTVLSLKYVLFSGTVCFCFSHR